MTTVQLEPLRTCMREDHLDCTTMFLDSALLCQLAYDRRGTDSIKWDGADRIFDGKAVFPMWVADMDFPVADTIQAALQNRIVHPIYGYADHDELVQDAAAQWMRRTHNWDIDQSDLALVQGVVPSLYAAVRAFSSPGDPVIVMPPIYPPFLSSITQNGRSLLSVPLLVDHGQLYTMDYDALELAMRRSKLLLFCSPHNPVGRVWSRVELERLVEMADRHSVQIVSDEIHADLLYGSTIHTPLPKIQKNCIYLGSATKSFNIGGIGGGIVWVTEPHVRDVFLRELERSCLLGMNLFSKTACKAAWLGGDVWMNDVRSYLYENALYVQKFLVERVPEVRYRVPEASFLAWVDLRPLNLSDQQIASRLSAVGLGLNLGPSFGTGGAGHVRINFGTSRSLLEKGLDLFYKAFSA